MSISVLMPIYNCADYLMASLSSVLKQTFQDFEIIIVDNESTDDPLSIIKSFNDSRIKYYSIERLSLANTLNTGLAKCNFDIVARLDADDLMANTRLEKQYKSFKNSSENLILSSWYAIFENNKILYTVRTSTVDAQIKKRLALHSEIIHSGVMYNKNFILENGGYDPQVKIEDYELWLRLSSKAEFRNIPEYLSFVRYRQNSISWSNIEKKNIEIYHYQEKYFSDKYLSYLGYKTFNEQNIVKGWREYFYGDKKKARKFWKVNNILTNARIAAAFPVTFISKHLLEKFKESRMKFRLKYYFTFFSSVNINLRKEFSNLILK